MSTADILRRASEVLDERGHIKGDLINDQGVCAVGALKVAVLESGGLKAETFRHITDQWDLMFDRPFLSAYTAVQGKVGTSGNAMAVAIWNDEAERTKEDVQKVFLQTADEIEFR